MNSEIRIKNLEEELELIKNRNKRVKADKAWETSKVRIFLLGIITCITTSLLFYLLEIENFYLTSLIPAIGFIISVQSIPLVKKWWVKNRYNN